MTAPVSGGFRRVPLALPVRLQNYGGTVCALAKPVAHVRFVGTTSEYNGLMMNASSDIPSTEFPVTLTDIRAAYARIQPYIHRTPVVTCDTLNQLLDAELFFKCEQLQKAGAFKSRGACNAVFALSDEDAARGVVTHSSGNHAAALARAAKMRGCVAHIVMPANAPAVKVAAVEHYGGRITFCEATQAAREAACSRIQQETGANLVHPYDDWRIITGQATCAVEFLEDVPNLDVVVTPVGGGGLLAGTALAVQFLQPTCKVWAGEPAELNDAFTSWQTGVRQPATGRPSCADGLLTALGELTFPVIHQHVAAIHLADESQIRDAQRLLFERAKLVVEPSAAVPLAALLALREQQPTAFAGQRLGIVLSGGNLDVTGLIPTP